MQDQNRPFCFTRFLLSLSILGILLLSPPTLLDALQVEGNADSDGTEGAQTAKMPLDMAAAAGDAIYSSPITVPPGIYGMAPDVSLTYSSSAGNGRFGVGWELSLGYPLTIERSTRKGVPSYDTEIDEFTIGGQRLIRDGDVYHTRIKNFWKIEIIAEACHFCRPGDPPQPTAWRVTLKDGTQLLYAYQPWSRHAPRRIFRWYLESITDIYGNRISLDYESQTDDRYGIRHPYLSRISYGYPEPNGGGTPLNEIEFWISD